VRDDDENTPPMRVQITMPAPAYPTTTKNDPSLKVQIGVPAPRYPTTHQEDAQHHGKLSNDGAPSVILQGFRMGRAGVSSQDYADQSNSRGLRKRNTT